MFFHFFNLRWLLFMGVILDNIKWTQLWTIYLKLTIDLIYTHKRDEVQKILTIHITHHALTHECNMNSNTEVEEILGIKKRNCKLPRFGEEVAT